jgi:hypothetical protein
MGEKFVVSSVNRGVQRLSTVGSTLWGMAWCVWQSSLASRSLRQRPDAFSKRRGRCCSGLCPQAWRGGVPRAVRAGALAWSKLQAAPEGWRRYGSRQHSRRNCAEYVRTARRKFPQCGYSVRNGGAVTGVGGLDSGHSHCGEWGPDAHLSWALWQSGWNLSSPYDGQVGERTVCPLRRGSASNETERICTFEGRIATLERGGENPPARGTVRSPRARRRRSATFEGKFATLERGGADPSRSRVGSLPRARRRCEVRSRDSAGSPRAKRRSPLEPEGGSGWETCRVGRVLGFFESFPFPWREGGRGPSWARLPQHSFCVF